MQKFVLTSCLFLSILLGVLLMERMGAFATEQNSGYSTMAESDDADLPAIFSKDFPQQSIKGKGRDCEKDSCPIAMVKPLKKETELPAMRITLGLVNFVGDLERRFAEEEAYAILPLMHNSVLEVYDLQEEEGKLIAPDQPSVKRAMAGNEAYVLRMDSKDSGMRVICVTTDSGQKRCWRPGFDALRGDFIRWSTTKGIK